MGPSPRGRGRQRPGGALRPPRGTIPTWAGRREALRAALPGSGTIPRVGGGDRCLCHLGIAVVGTIPAWAGETAHAATRRPISRDHPRVGGGDLTSLNAVALSYIGTIPAWAGETSYHDRRRTRSTIRTIPAWAGETARFSEYFTCIVHLRTIPAWAGETPAGSSFAVGVYMGPSPRGRGRQNLQRHNARLQSLSGPSPRGRGRPHRSSSSLDRSIGTIPAWAGETKCRHHDLARPMGTDHPRVGGGDSSQMLHRSGRPYDGPSPRGRGRRRPRDR